MFRIKLTNFAMGSFVEFELEIFRINQIISCEVANGMPQFNCFPTHILISLYPS